MELREITIGFAKHEGVTYPAVARARFHRAPDDPPNVLFDEKGNVQPRSHMIDMGGAQLLDPKPEKDPNANVSAEDAATIKAAIALHTANGVLAMQPSEDPTAPPTPVVLVP